MNAVIDSSVVLIENYFASLDRENPGAKQDKKKRKKVQDKNPESPPSLVQRWERIQKMRADKNLYLSVIGEFSSGKSTFLNALIQDDLLSTDVVQGTTTAPTVLEYGGFLRATVWHPSPPPTKTYKLL